MPTSRERSLGQAAMEWPPLVRIYESRLWRRSPLFALANRISFERECSLILEAAGLGEETQVLDLACGSGIYSRRFARIASRGRVVGLDLSMPMLRYALRRRRSEEGLDNFLLVRGSVMEMPFANGRFDVVNCCGALHLFPNPREALDRIARVLRPGGRFTIAAFRRGDTPRDKRRADRQTRFWGIHSFTPTELETWMKEAGLVEARVLHAAGGWLLMTASRANRN